MLVNNAGITRDTLMLRMSEEQWDQVIETNLKSVFNLTKHLLRPMLKKRSGSISNMSSVVGEFGNAGQANYAASKAGDIGFTKALAQEGAKKGITVNVVCPGYIDTEMVRAVPEKVLESIIATIPVGRLGKAEEIASMCGYLASDEAAFINGATMTVNGSQYIAG